MSSIKTTLAALAAGLSLSACGSPPRWVNPDMPEAQARVVFYECQRDGQQMIAQSASNLLIAIDQTRDCLHAHGFHQERGGGK